MSQKLRIYLTGVGGQGTLTATTLLTRIILDQNLPVVAGEIHGMAQRGGVVESTILIGGWQSPSLQLGEADILLGFEPLETLRGLAYLRTGGAVFSSTEFSPPPSVSAGKAVLPPMESIEHSVAEVADKAWFFPIKTIGLQAGSQQSGNTALIAAACASGLIPVSIQALEAGIGKYMPPKLVEVNLKAVALGVEALRTSTKR